MSATTSKPDWSPETVPDHLPVNDAGAALGLDAAVDDGWLAEVGGWLIDVCGVSVECARFALDPPPCVPLRMTTAVVTTVAASARTTATPIATLAPVPSPGFASPAGRGWTTGGA